MTYRAGWGENARHFAVAVDSAKEAWAAAASMRRHRHDGVVVVHDGIGVVPTASLRRLAAAQEIAARERVAGEERPSQPVEARAMTA